MASVIQIEQKIAACTAQGTTALTKEDQINRFLDQIIKVTDWINEINSCYLQLFELIDILSSCKVEKEEETKALESILIELRQFTTKASFIFSLLSKNTVVKNGCKSALEDLRSNIRTLREYIEDIEEAFLLEDDTSEIDRIISELS